MVNDDILEGLSLLLSNLTNCPFQFERFMDRFLYIKKHYPVIQVYVAYHEYVGIYACGTLVIEPKFIHDCQSVAHIEDVAVLPDLQRENIGSKLVKFLINKAFHEFSCYKIILDSDKPSFYEKLGFVVRDKHFELRKKDYTIL